jgi:hypothetical protein
MEKTTVPDRFRSLISVEEILKTLSQQYLNIYQNLWKKDTVLILSDTDGSLFT